LTCVGVEHRLDRTLALERRRDRRGDAVARKVLVEPRLGDALELPEQVELGRLAGIAPFRVEQALREVVEQRRLAHLAEVLQAEVHRFADDALVPRDGRAHQVRRQLERRVGNPPRGGT
jgi:hypothetical protein